MARRSTGRPRTPTPLRRRYSWIVGPLVLGTLFLAHLIAQKNPQINTPRHPAGEYFRHDAAPTETDSLTGLPRISDGDTIRIGQTRIRFYGIDAPEKAQRCTDGTGQTYLCGAKARQALASRINSHEVHCQRRNTDRYGRTVAVCRLNGEDLNDWMVRQGWAVAYRQYGSDYISAEDDAREHHRGIWAGKFEMPAEWRRQHRH